MGRAPWPMSMNTTTKLATIGPGPAVFREDILGKESVAIDSEILGCCLGRSKIFNPSSRDCPEELFDVRNLCFDLIWTVPLWPAEDLVRREGWESKELQYQGSLEDQDSRHLLDRGCWQ